MTTENCTNICVTKEQKCAWENHYAGLVQQMIEANKPDTSLADKLLGNVSIYDSAKSYSCGDRVLYEGSLYKSKVNGNKRNPHDGDAWDEFDSLSDMMSKVESLSHHAHLQVPYHVSCGPNPHCVGFASKGRYVAIKVDSGNVTPCGDKIFIDEIYIAKTDTAETPSSQSDDWEGPINPLIDQSSVNIMIGNYFANLEEC